jgi:hypothetical protein
MNRKRDWIRSGRKCKTWEASCVLGPTGGSLGVLEGAQDAKQLEHAQRLCQPHLQAHKWRRTKGTDGGGSGGKEARHLVSFV